MSRLLAEEDQLFEEQHPRSRQLFERAKAHLLGGVPMNWMVRWAGPYPVFVQAGEGAYFTDVFFNHIYSSSRANLASRASLTDEYTRELQAYLIGVKNDSESYSKIVQNLYQYFTRTTRFTTIGFGEFVNRIVHTSIPDEYYRQFSTEDKDEVLSSIVCDLVSNLAAFVTTPEMLRRIIDEHDKVPATTIRMIQDNALSSLFEKRAALMNKFIRKQGQARESISVDIVDDLKRVLKRLAKEKSEAVAQVNKLENKIARLEEKVASLEHKLASRQSKYQRLVDLVREAQEHGPEAAGYSTLVPPSDGGLAEVERPAQTEAPPLSRTIASDFFVNPVHAAAATEPTASRQRDTPKLIPKHPLKTLSMSGRAEPPPPEQASVSAGVPLPAGARQPPHVDVVDVSGAGSAAYASRDIMSDLFKAEESPL